MHGTSDMNHDPLDRYLMAREFRGMARLGSRRLEVEVATPDLRGCARSVSGDWGPTYALELQPWQIVSVAYGDPLVGRYARYVLAGPEVALSSPALAVERERWPFHLEITDAERCLKLLAHLEPDGSFHRLEVRCLQPPDHIGLIFPPGRGLRVPPRRTGATWRGALDS